MSADSDVDGRDQDVDDQDGLTVRFESNDRQNLLLFDSGPTSAVVAVDSDADADDVLELVDAVEAEIAHTAHGLRAGRRTIAERRGER